jgi:hypothetical protein
MLAEERRQITLQANETHLNALSLELAENPQEAELIREIHKNRVFPEGSSLEDQIQESHAIANYKRIQAKNSELSRKVASQQNASRNTATTHRDPQASVEPDMAPDLKASMKRAGYTYNNQARRYEKKLENGKTLVKEANKPPYLAN